MALWCLNSRLMANMCFYTDVCRLTFKIKRRSQFYVEPLWQTCCQHHSPSHFCVPMIMYEKRKKMYKNQFTKKVFNMFKLAEEKPSIKKKITYKSVIVIIKHKNTFFSWRPHIHNRCSSLNRSFSIFGTSLPGRLKLKVKQCFTATSLKPFVQQFQSKEPQRMNASKPESF